MLNQYVAQWKSRFQKQGGVSDSGSRRVGHGSTEWSLPTDADHLMQPQDGAVDSRVRVAEMRPHLNRTLINEPEDAWLTGGTRSLTRRLMGLNVTVQATAVVAKQPATMAVKQRAKRVAAPAAAVQVA